MMSLEKYVGCESRLKDSEGNKPPLALPKSEEATFIWFHIYNDRLLFDTFV